MKREFRVKKKNPLFSCHRMAITGIFEFRNGTVNITELKGLVISFLQHFLCISVIYNKVTSTLQYCSVLHIKTFTNFPK